MSPASCLLFAAVLAAAVATPGPSTTALVARVLGQGSGDAQRLGAGLLLGDLFWLLCALLGAGALALQFAGLFTLIRYLGVAYLLYLAWVFWHAAPGAVAATPDDRPSRPLLSGLLLALGNPKTMLFYLALLPGIVSLDSLALADALLLTVVAALVVGGVLAAHVLLAERLRRHFQSPAALRRIHRGSALLMAGAAGGIVLR